MADDPLSRISSNDLHWVAGFLEGEGYFGCGDYCRIQARQVQREPLERMLRLLGGRIDFIDMTAKRPWSDVHVWTICNNYAAEVMRALHPQMSPKRARQIDGALTRWAGRSRGKGSVLWSESGRCWRGHALTPENIYIEPTGKRHCHVCKRLHAKERYRRRKAAVAITSTPHKPYS